jgi:hypothetical protein
VRLDREEMGAGGVLRRYIQTNRLLPIVTVTVDSVVYLRGIRGVRKLPWTLRGTLTPPMLCPHFVDQALQRSARLGEQLDLRLRSICEGFSSLDPGEDLVPASAAVPPSPEPPAKRKRKPPKQKLPPQRRQRNRA